MAAEKSSSHSITQGSGIGPSSLEEPDAAVVESPVSSTAAVVEVSAVLDVLALAVSPPLVSGWLEVDVELVPGLVPLSVSAVVVSSVPGGTHWPANPWGPWLPYRIPLGQSGSSNAQ
jgi:hypothetical protein